MLPGMVLEKLLTVFHAARANPASFGITKCRLCSAGFTRVGVFVPTDADLARRLGQPEGKTRYVLYGLCDRCHALPDHNERIEAAILDRIENPIIYFALDANGQLDLSTE